jgi:hypothetical protein
VQAVGPAPSRHHAAGELVDDDDLAVLDDVVDIALVERVRPEPLLHVVQDRDVLWIVEVVDVQQPLAGGDPLLRQRHRFRLLVDDEIALALLLDLRQLALDDRRCTLEPRDDAIDLVVELGGFLGRAGDDERRARLVDEDRVDLVDDGVVQLALHQLLEREPHVVAQVVEAEFVVGAVRDVAQVGGAPVDGAQRRHADVGRGVRGIVAERRFVLDDAHRQSERVVERPHPLRVALGEVVVDGHDVHALARQRVEVRGQRRHERLALARRHLGDDALVQHHAADQLHVEVTHPEGPARGFAADRKGLGQDVFDLGAVGDALAELVRLGAKRGVVEGVHGGLERVDLGHHRHHPLDVALVLGAEDPLEDRVDHRSAIIRPGLVPPAHLAHVAHRVHALPRARTAARVRVRAPRHP